MRISTLKLSVVGSLMAAIAMTGADVGKCRHHDLQRKRHD